MTHVTAVLRGGPSADYRASIRSGQAVLDAFREMPGMHHDIFIDREGVWHERGRRVKPEQILQLTDVVFNALHGSYGEDGQVQKILRTYGIPHTGSEVLPSFLASHKALAKDLMREKGMPVPRDVLVESAYDVDTRLAEAIRQFGSPLTVKSVFGEGGHAVAICGEAEAAHHSTHDFLAHGPVLLEEYIRGKEASVFVIENFRGEELYICPPIEIAHREGRWHEVCPGNFSRDERERIDAFAREAFRTLGLRHYAKIDFLVTPREVYFLEANALPKLHDKSLFSKALSSVGAKMSDMFYHVKDLAVSGK